jgi:hypothetical protein
MSTEPTERWRKPLEVCEERTPVPDRVHDDRGGELRCILPPGHEPPHWDDWLQLWWYEPEPVK